MAKELVLQVAINAAGGVQTLNELQKNVQLLRKEIAGKPIGSKEFNDLNDKLAESNKAVRTLNQSFKAIDAGSAKGSIGEIKQQIKDLTLALNDVAEGSPIAKKLEADLSIAKGALAEFKQRTKGLSGDELAGSFAKFGAGVAGSFGLATQALQVFGTKSESITKAQIAAEKSIAVVVSAKAVAEGVEAGVKLVSIAQTRLYTTLLQLETAATSKNVVVKYAATAAMRVLNAVMKANPILLVVGALITLGGALAAFSDSTDEATEKQNKLKAELESQAQTQDVFEKAFTKAGDKINDNYTRQINVLKSKKGSEEEVYKTSSKNIAAQIYMLEYLLGYLGKLSPEQKKVLDDLKAQRDILDNEEAQRKADAGQKASDEANKRKEAELKLQSEIGKIRANAIGDNLQREIALEKIGLNERLSAIKGNSTTENTLRIELRKESDAKIEKLIKDSAIRVAQLQDDLAIAQAGNAGDSLFEAKKKKFEDDIQTLSGQIAAEQAKVDAAKSKGQNVDESPLLNLKIALQKNVNELDILTNEFKNNTVTTLNSLTQTAISNGANYISERKTQIEEELLNENLAPERRKELYAQLDILNQGQLDSGRALIALQVKDLEDKRDAELLAAKDSADKRLEIEQNYNAKIAGLKSSPEQIAEESALQLTVLEEEGQTRLDAQLALLDKQKEQELSNANLTAEKKLLIEKDYNDKKRQLAFDYQQSTLAITADSLGKIQGIFKEDSIAYKAFGIAQATISTYLGASQALTDKTIPNTFARIAATIGVIAVGLQQVTKIAGVKLSTGGEVRGAGTGTSDSIPAQLSNGESVINARSTQMFKPLLSAINQAGGGVAFGGASIPQLALGGIVSSNGNTPNITINNNDSKISALINEVANLKQSPAPVYYVHSEAKEQLNKFDVVESRSVNSFLS